MNRFRMLTDKALAEALVRADAGLEREVIRLRSTDPAFANVLHTGLAIEDEIARRAAKAGGSS